MQFYYLNIHAPHWLDLQRMVEENYSTPDDNRTVLLGSCAKYSVKAHKEMINFNENVVYQLEPLVDGHWHTADNVIRNLEGADEVWDYDLDNIEILRRNGIDAKFRPCLYTESLKRIQNKEEPDIDVLFCGTPTPYRTKMIHDAIFNYPFTSEQHAKFGNITFTIAFNFLQEKLDALMANSKIILNLNPYEGECRQQQTRIFYALTNNKCVLSQKSNRNYFGNLIEEFSTENEMIEKIMGLVSNDNWRRYTQLDYKGYSKNLKDMFKL